MNPADIHQAFVLIFFVFVAFVLMFVFLGVMVLDLQKGESQLKEEIEELKTQITPKGDA